MHAFELQKVKIFYILLRFLSIRSFNFVKGWCCECDATVGVADEICSLKFRRRKEDGLSQNFAEFRMSNLAKIYSLTI